ncbi:non-ribosomal peptide synthetase, partial [Pseudomonas sp. S12(2018)]
LVGYVLPHDNAADPTALREELKTRLKAELPDYMVPTHLLFLEQWPLTANGKLDRRALPAPDASLLQREYLAPQTELQQRIAAIWQQVLGCAQVGLADSFFELGGHSLLATQVIVRLREQLGLEVPLKDLFIAEDLLAFSASVQALQVDTQPVEDELAKSLAALKRLSAEELEKLIS